MQVSFEPIEIEEHTRTSDRWRGSARDLEGGRRQQSRAGRGKASHLAPLADLEKHAAQFLEGVCYYLQYGSTRPICCSWKSKTTFICVDFRLNFLEYNFIKWRKSLES